MRIKFKCTPDQYSELIQIVAQLPYDRMAVSNIELINLKYLYYDGLKKINSLRIKSFVDMKFKQKETQFSIDVNHYEALKKALSECENAVSIYTKSIFEGIKTSAEPQILRAISGYRLIG